MPLTEVDGDYMRDLCDYTSLFDVILQVSIATVDMDSSF